MNENKKTLGDIKEFIDSSAVTYPALMSHNLGHRTLKFAMPIKQFIQISAVGSRKNIAEIESFKEEFHAQRDLLREHAKGLGRYTLMGLVKSEIQEKIELGEVISEEILSIQKELGEPPYASLQPLVTNIRRCNPGGDDLIAVDVGESFGRKTGVYDVTLSQQHLLWVVDGQHRREGFDMVLDFLSKVTRTFKYPKKGLYEPVNYSDQVMSDQVNTFWNRIFEIALTRASVSIECHLGLNERQEQQLFYDLNSKGRKVVQSLGFLYDRTDPINVFVAETLLDGGIIPFEPSDKDITNWSEDDGKITRKDINNVTSLLCTGKTSSKSATPTIVSKRKEFMIKFWEAIVGIENFGKPAAKSKTVVAQTVVLKALAKLANELVYGHQKILDHKGYDQLLISIINGGLDFSHENKLWHALLIDKDSREKQFPGISNYISIPDETNLDAGVVDINNNWVRFGSRHNDIFPRIGDSIRWKLKLSPRPSVVKALSEVAP